MRFLAIFCAAALVVCLAATAYAETQSIKVSGDLTVRTFLRDNYALQGSPAEDGSGVRTGADCSTSDWIMGTTAVQVNADLTDNIAACVRLLNQRDWDVYTKNVRSTTSLATNGRGGYTENGGELAIGVDLAYVELKEFIYAPLSLTLGRQDIWIGKGFIVGANMQNPNSTLSAPEYTDINSFDAFKAVLDYDPWKITGLFSKIYEDAVDARDDVNLWGVNVGYIFGSYNADAEAYWFLKDDQSVATWGPVKHGNEVHTTGARTSFDPINNLTLNAEVAYQFGSYVGSRLQVNNRDRSAWALDVGGEWRYWMDKCAWKPKVGAEAIIYSGNQEEENPGVAAGNFTGWDPMYRGKFDSAYREFIGKFYATARYPNNPDRANHLYTYADASFTNQQQYILMGSIEPIDSVKIKANYNIFWTLEKFTENSKSDGFIGHELDLNATWDYTEDVSFGLLGAWFLPGEVYYDKLDATATDIVGTMKVSF